jgi:hypothetical protein
MRYNIKMVLTETSREGWTEFVWPGIMKNDGLF